VNAAQSTVLVVEDECLVRLDAAAGLREAGFHVVEAATADEAMNVFEALPEIDVVFTDIEMPGRMDGLELARRVRRLRPGVRLLLTSGAVRPTETEIPDRGAFLDKPYSSQMVARAIRRLLG
jgi:CheY-like chemotaxis protein